MKVYDVVHIVEIQNGSIPQGRWFVNCFDDELKAHKFKDRCNDARLVSGHYFRIEEHDELSPERAPAYPNY